MAIKTVFPKFNFEENNLPKWIFYFHAGLQWLQTYELAHDSRVKDSYWLWFVEPYALYFSVELFIKSWAARENPSFNAQTDKDTNRKRIGHRATAIIQEYKTKVPELDALAQDKHLIELIRTYEGTLVTRFGETAVSMNPDDTKLLYQTAEALANKLEQARHTPKQKRDSSTLW